MQILVSSDYDFCGSDELTRRIEGVVEGMLERFQGRVTRVAVRLSHLTGSAPADQLCSMEARVPGMRPVTVSHQAATLSEAIHGAASKLRHAVSEGIRVFHREVRVQESPETARS